MIGIDPAETFRQEARDLLEELESGLLDLGQDPQNRALIDSSFRALHTIKGSGAMFGFTTVANFVHEFETAFDRVRKGQSDASSRLIDIALEAKDYISALIEDEETDVDGDAILSRLRVIVGSSATAPAADVAPVAPRVAQDDIRTWRLEFYLPSDALVFGTNPQLLLAELADIGPTKVMALTERVPALDTLDPEVPHIGWRVDIDAVDPSDAIDDVFMFLRDAMELTLVEVAPEAAPAPVSEPAEPAPSSVSKPAAPAKADATGDKAASTSLRVPAERLDELMDRVGELVIAQARLSQLAAHSDDATLKSVAEDLERLSSGLRDTTMGIRMVPIGTLFSRFRRLVYDLSSELGKPIEFVTAGEDTELDKNVIERLADPLVHLIRNAVDHGLESPDRRRASGKSETGLVRLSATYSGAEVAISVTDDGAGLDAQRIRAKAEENGLISADAKLSDQELYQLIFAPGFSTAQQVTSLSGRGVGMDVVKRTIDGLRGTIELNTNPGAGTTASLRLPLTLAIIEGMLVRVGDGLYTIPLAAVEECVELTAEAEATRSGRNFLDIRGSLVPYLRLREVFQTPGETDEYQKVVIVSSGEGRVGLVVDQIIGNNQTVIKQLSRLHSGIRTFSGATILGDGSVALILDTAHLVSAGQSYVGRSERAAS
ncbi:chemotaxis protein CheA [Devosia sp. MC532]|uniref:chemotaxis protein CheA n=1 Tax=Devosia sp. MC532 TaxID=2799788 RepID=UPI0018F2D5DB|nr:chemotaxis protein CheA [Devosia sp. MC532]MBJ7578590.1 chemotaxis protein CheA [Devosia sp. MC532]